MSVYFVKGKGWRYDFTLQGTRHTMSWFKRKQHAKKAETQRREEILNPSPVSQVQQIPTDMDFLELVNRRLDFIKAYNSERHYTDHLYLARKWIKIWGRLTCSGVTTEMIQAYLLKRKRHTSGFTANNLKIG